MLPIIASRFRPSLAGIVGALLAATAARAAADLLPVTVPVAGSQAYLRAGPGDDFYPTERLERGTPLEVWAIDGSGYCAVRPVEGSFSWLRAGDVKREADDRHLTPHVERAPARGVGVVVTDGAVARIGSQLNDLRHVTQVALEAGERVRIIEDVRIAEGRHAGHWFRIEPPSGEFRWARVDDLDLPAELLPHVEPGQDGPAAGLAAAGDAIEAIREAGAAVAEAVAQEPAVADAAPRRLESSNGVVRLLAGWLPLGTNVFDPSQSTATPPPAVSAGATAVSGDELTDIDLALSLAVTGASDTWNLPPLRERLRLAAFRATSESERLRAQAIDARLTRFEAIQARQRSLAAIPDAQQQPLRLGGMWSSLSALGSRPVRPGVMPGGAPAGGQPTWTPPDQTETSGRLATVISRRPDAPRWALVDADNNVLVFVTPQPGVNLAPLVGQQVSVRGARGYMPEYKRPYLVASEARTRIAALPPSSGPAPDRTQ